MELQVGVKIVIQNKEGKFLLLEKNGDKYPTIKKDELLDIVGGRIEVGSSLFENLKREIFEETKLSLIEEPNLLTAQDILRPDKHVVRLTYMGHIEGEPQLSEEEISYKWFTKDEVLQQSNLDPYAREVFKKFISD